MSEQTQSALPLSEENITSFFRENAELSSLVRNNSEDYLARQQYLKNSGEDVEVLSPEELLNLGTMTLLTVQLVQKAMRPNPKKQRLRLRADS